MFDLNELIKYHVDMHVHCNPDCSPLHPQPVTNEEVVRLSRCRDAWLGVKDTHVAGSQPGKEIE